MRALVLSGGGSKGAYQVGALEHIMGDLGVEYDIVAGISVGALNGSYLAQFAKGREQEAIDGLVEVWNKVHDGVIFKQHYPFPRKVFSHMLSVLTKNSIYDSTPLNNWVEDLLDPEMLKTSGKELAIGAVSLKTAEGRYFDQHSPDIVKAVQASASYPIFFKPVGIEEQNWTDGGVRNVIPMEKAIRMGATEMDVIICSPLSQKHSMKSNNLFNSLLSVISILLDEVSLTDVVIGNMMAEQRDVKVRLMAPSVYLGDALDFNQTQVKKNREIGYNQAKTMNWS